MSEPEPSPNIDSSMIAAGVEALMKWGVPFDPFEPGSCDWADREAIVSEVYSAMVSARGRETIGAPAGLRPRTAS